MPISSANLNPASSNPANSLSGQVQSPSAKPPKPDSQSSTIVTLSEQGRKLSQSQHSGSSQANQAQQSSHASQTPKDTSHRPGIPAIEGETRNGRVSTYA